MNRNSLYLITGLSFLVTTIAIAQPLQWVHGGYVQDRDIRLQAISPSGEIYLSDFYNRLLKRSTDGLHIDTIVVPPSLSYVEVLPSGRLAATSSHGVGIGNIDGDSILIRRSGNFGGFRLAVLPTGTILMYNGNRGYQTNEAGTMLDSVIFPQRLNNDDGILASPNGLLFLWSRQNGVYRSTNAGSNWVRVTTGFPTNASYHCLVVSPANGMLYCGTHEHGMFISENNGDSWQPMNEGIPILDVKKIAVDDASNILISGWGTGVFHYSVVYNNWHSGGFEGPYIDRIAFLPNRNPVINYSGVYYSADRGTTWSGVGPDIFVEELLADGDSVFASNLTLYRSTNRGEGWCFTSLATTDSFHYENELYALGKTHNGAILAGNRYIYRSLDHGRTWNTVYTTTNENHAIRCFAASPSGVVLAGTVVDYASLSFWLQRSVNSGENWQHAVQFSSEPRAILWLTGSSWLIGLQNGLYRTYDDGLNLSLLHPTMSIEALVRGENDTIYAGDWGGYVSRSTDNGATWVRAGEPLAANTVIYSLLILQNGDILAGTSPAGVFRSTDQGNSWTVQNAGLGNTRVYSLAQTNDGIIYAGTEYGIYRCENFSRISEPLGSVFHPTQTTLLPAYPNPFNATTVIRYQLPQAENVQLDVVDLLGRSVKQLFHGRQTAGQHTTKFSGVGLASGVYIVRLTSEHGSAMQKVVIVK